MHHEELLDAVHRGDEAAWAALFDEYYPRLYRLFRARASGHQEAEQLAIEVFLLAFRSARERAPTDEPLGIWFLRLARRVLAVAYRDVSDERLGEVREEFVSTEARVQLAWLPPDQRAALVLHHVVGLAPDEVAAVMERSPAEVRALLRGDE